MNGDALHQVRCAAKKKILILPHALQQMTRADRMIEPSEVRKVVLTGEVIEDYPEDDRGQSCLILGTGKDERKIHVVCAPKDEYLAVITTYIPDPEGWDGQFKVRRTR